MSAPVSTPVYPGSSGHGAAYKEVLVQAVDYKVSKAVVIDQLGKQMQVRCDIMRAKGNVPAVGERWLVDRQYGVWTFAAIMNGGTDGVIIPTASVTDLDDTLQDHVDLINNVDNSAQSRDNAQAAATTGQIQAKGDLWGGTAAGAATRLPVGTANLQTLVPDPTTPTGLSWKTPIALPVSLSGATAAGRYVGNTVSGPPTTGTFLKGDWVTDQAGYDWNCSVAGSPGTWVTRDVDVSRVSTLETNVGTNTTNINNNSSNITSLTNTVTSLRTTGKSIWYANSRPLNGGGGDIILTTWTTYYDDSIASLNGSGLFQFNSAGRWALNFYCQSDSTVSGSMLWYILAGSPSSWGPGGNTWLRARGARAAGFANSGRLDQNITWTGRVAAADASQAFAIHVSWQASDGATNATLNYLLDLEYLGAV